MALSDVKAKSATIPAGKRQIKLSDAGGLYLLVKSAGKYWKLKYRFAGKEKTLSIGVYPALTLKEARAARDVAKDLIKAEIDPSQRRQDERHNTSVQSSTFEWVADEWFASKRPYWADSTIRHNASRLGKYIKPRIGSRPIEDVTPFEVLAIARIAEGLGFNELAHRIVRLIWLSLSTTSAGCH